MIKTTVTISLCLAIIAAGDFQNAHSQNVGVNPTGAPPDASAMLDVDASPGNNKGMLVPRVSLLSTTDAATIPSPATSLLVYNTNPAMIGGGVGFWYWSGSMWVGVMNNSGSNLNHGKQLFTSSGSFTVPVGVTTVWITAAGGGGGGGGGGGSYEVGPGTVAYEGGFGGGGGGAHAILSQSFAVTSTQTLTVTVGAGGVAGTGGTGGIDGGAASTSGTVGNAGGSSIVAGTTTLTVTGGNGGGLGVRATSGGGGAGGAGGASGGTGGNTGLAGDGAGGGLDVFSSVGGSGIFGNSYPKGTNYNAIGAAGSGYGSGGAGGGGGLVTSMGTPSNGRAGAAGRPGFVLIEW